MILLSSDPFLNELLSKNYQEHGVSNSLDPHQNQHVGSDLGPKLVCKGYQQLTNVTISKDRDKPAHKILVLLA